jgi:nitrate/TMAO reductase-like tetraheme cytochrome c subunit
MNANELADELQKMFVGEEYDRLVHEIPNVLRQQQAEIEVLKKFKAEIDAENKNLFEAVQKANAMWDRATGVQE